MNTPRRRADFPFSPARFPFFYGWVIVAAATVGIVMSIPGQTMGVSVFTDHLIAALSLSRVQLSEAYMFGTLASSFLLPLAGASFDRRGARAMVVVASLGVAVTLVYLSRCDAIAAGFSALLGGSLLPRTVVEIVVLAVGFFSVRFWGQGVLTMVSRAMLGKWFRRRRGLAAGISGVVVSATFASAPSILSPMIGALGWRGAWLTLAVLLGAGMTSLGWLLYRDNPEECGLRMDGAAPDDDASDEADDAPGSSESHDFSLGEAMATYGFWIFNAALALPALIGTAMTFHIVDLGRRGGLSEAEAVGLFPWMAAVSIATNLAGGWVSDRVRIKYLLWTLVSMQAVGCAGLLDLAEPAGRVLVVVGFGVASGLFALLMAVVWPRFFGRTHLGAISSVNMSVVVFASAVGPWIFALSEALTGDYRAANVGCAWLSLLCLVAAIGVRNPQRRSRPEAAS